MAVDAIAPNAYGGTFALENGEGEGGLIMSNGTVARFLATHAVWDIGPRQPGFARYGKFSGTGAAAVSRPDGLDFAYVFNYQVDDPDTTRSSNRYTRFSIATSACSPVAWSRQSPGS